MNSTKHFLFIAILAISVNVQGQIFKDSSITISGSLDAYFRHNLNSTNNMENGGVLAPATSFANLPGFALGMANVVAEVKKNKTGAVVDLAFGPRAVDADFGSTAPLNVVNQLYGYYYLTEKIKATLGNFNTFLGYEYISAVKNFNYSTSYMFSYGPFSHNGLKFDLDFGKGFTGMVGVFDPTDKTDFNPNNSYYGGTQLGYTGAKLSSFLNFLIGEGYFQIDYTGGLQASDNYFIGVNATLTDDLFSGVALYNQYKLNDKWKAGLRFEYFNDNGLDILPQSKSSVTDLTFSLNYEVENFRIIPEFRVDLYSDGTIVTDAEKVNTSNNLASFLLATVYQF